MRDSSQDEEKNLELQAHLRSHLELKETCGDFAEVRWRMSRSGRAVRSLETVGRRKANHSEGEKEEVCCTNQSLKGVFNSL
jgi:hypothetical protein